MTLKDAILAAAKADAIPTGESGLWEVRKFSLAKPMPVERAHGYYSRGVIIPAGNYTHLFRWTESTLHLGHGESVMHDTPEELNKHLEFMLKACGRVLITGLGLGCVIRGCLANPNVLHVTCVERDQDVLKLVAPHMPKTGLTIIHADARDYVKSCGHFDCAWNDVWTDTDGGEQHLSVVHTELMSKLAGKVTFQGAWEYPREYRRLFRQEAHVI